MPASASLVSAPPVSPFIASSHGDAQHRFWDKQNRILFAATAALNGADFAVTRANLQSGGQELNPVVRVFGRSTAGLAVNFIGETAGVMSVSYFFHKTGHHNLERAVSLVNIGASAGAGATDYPTANIWAAAFSVSEIARPVATYQMIFAPS